MYDVMIIGGGVVGCCIARELTKKRMRIAVLEKDLDIGEGATKANSGIVHAGYDAVPGSLKASLNVKGNSLIRTLASELDFPYHNNGSMVLCFQHEKKYLLEELLERGQTNGVEGLQIMSGEEVRKMEPAVRSGVAYALYAPTGGIVCPFGLTIAMAENAAQNGAEFIRDTEVIGIRREKDCFRILCQNQNFISRVVVNCAGIYADQIHRMISKEPLTMIPRRGEYLLFDKEVGNLVSHTLFQLPTALGKGVLITPTVHGNLMMGPTAEDILDKKGTNTTSAGLDTVLKQAAGSLKEIPAEDIITSFAGLRANAGTGDFIIGEPKDAPGFFDVAGIDSPGLTSAPAIAVYVAGLLGNRWPAGDNDAFIGKRTGIRSGVGEVICRCETVTKEAVLEAIHRTPGAVSLDGVKRRVRAGMGRCQSGFCSPGIVELLAQELRKEKWEITKSGRGSEIICLPDAQTKT